MSDWKWTNDEHTEARKGAWTMHAHRDEWVLWHDDFGLNCIARSDELLSPTLAIAEPVNRVIADFLAWNATQPPAPVTLSHVEGAYLHLNSRISGDYLLWFVDGAWRWPGDSSTASYTPENIATWLKNGWEIVSHGILAPGTVTVTQPAEPTGLGAVVEVKGKRWVRTGDDEAQRWDNDGQYWKSWSELTALGPVTVLNEGVE